MESLIRLALVCLGVFALLIAPMFGSYLIYLLILANISAIYATSWNLLAGYNGQISLGHGLFFGLGAYTSAILTLVYDFPIWSVPIIWIVVPSLAGLAIGSLLIRMREACKAIATLVFCEMLYTISYLLTLRVKGYTYGAEEGIPVNPLGGHVFNYYFSVATLLIIVAMVHILINSRTGLKFIAIRDDEIAAESVGINVDKYKVIAFSVSGALAGIAGGMYAHFITSYADPSMFSITNSFEPIIITIVGGMGTLIGPIVAAYFLTIIFYSLAWLSEFRLIVYATLLTILLMTKYRTLKWPFFPSVLKR